MAGGESSMLMPVPEDSSSIAYVSEPSDNEFRQGEVISDVVQWVWDSEQEELVAVAHAFVIVASQDCDLLQDYNSRQTSQKSELNGILLYEAHKTFNLKATLAGSDIWRRVIKNNDERYHALQSAPAGCDRLRSGLPDLIIDFKRFFTIPAEELTKQCSQEPGAKRRCHLKEPYREHFQTRASFYLQRVGVPKPHSIVSPPLAS